MKIKTLLTLALAPCALLAQTPQTDEVKAFAQPLEMPTYALNPAETAPVFDCAWSYQRARRSVYPYPLNDNMTRARKTQTYNALYLENKYLKVCVLPEIGGRLFYALDKTNNYDIFYRQDAIKPANVGMLGAWISGGVEWNVFHHHRNTTHEPVSYKIAANPDGSKTIWLGETELRHRMSWAIGITLRPDKSYIEISGRLINSTQNSNSILYWANAATHANKDYQIIFPQSTQFGMFHCKSSFCHWPITRETYNGTEEYQNNIDASMWAAHPTGNSIFAYDLKDDFIAGYDHGKKAGTVLVGNHHIVKGGKFWSWGPNSGWPTKILTDNAGDYIELMSGAYSDNQPDYNWIYPYEVKTFTQYFYGIKDMGGVTKASKTAAINMAIKDGKILFGVNATQKLDNVRVNILRNGKVVFTKTANVSPETPLVETIPLSEGTASESELTMTLDDASGKNLLAYTPIKHDPNAKLPDIVRPPLKPREIENNEECYLVGLRNLQFHNPFINPADYFNEVLKRDPFDTRSNTKMGVYWRERGDPQKAILHLERAIKRQTKDYTRPVDCEATYNLGLVYKDLGQTDKAIETLYKATWNYAFNSAANYQLAQIYSGLGDSAAALERLDEAIAYNGRNFSALNLKGAILRRAGNLAEAEKCFAAVLKTDPINYYAEYERFLGGGKSDFRKMMADNPEMYLELAIKYIADGFGGTAEELLKYIDAKKPYPTVKMWLAYLADKRGDAADAKKLYAEALALPVGYCNPFRLETARVLETAKKYCPENFKIPYYLGNLFYDKQPQKAVEYWNEAASLNPQYAMAWRNLGWAHWKHFKEYAKAVEYYRKAVELDPNQPIFFEEIDQASEAAHVDPRKRFELLRANHKVCEKRYYPLAAEVITGTLAGEFDYVLKLLRECYFPTREGVANFHDVYVDALLMAGKKELDKKDFAQARKLFNEAFLFPETHQVFYRDPRRPRDAQIYYMVALSYELEGDKANAEKFFKKSAEVNTRRTDYRYWRALSLEKIGDKNAAKAMFKALAKEGAGAVVKSHTNFYGAEGTTGATVESINAKAHFTQALGELGLGNRREAKKLLEKSAELHPESLWANAMLKGL